MALSKHELLHLNAMLAEQVSDKKDSVMMEKLRAVKSKTSEQYLNYLDGVKAKVENIISTEIFPEGLDPSDIHDYLEKS